MIIITNISGNDALVNARQKMLVFYTGHPALDAGSRIQGLDSRFHGNENMKVRLLSAKGIIALNNKSRKEAHDEGAYSIGQS